ncbi:MAG: UvrB/UvrC motif-containing protein [Clostridiales bacterium]|nr:UvrB/UvrC motif-containing protein [Clostridiales bacterium]
MARKFLSPAKEIPQGKFSLPEDLKIRGPRTARAVWGSGKMLEFELAAALRDQIIELRGK